MTDALSAFAALSQETRLRVLKDLVRAGPAGRPAGSLAATVGAAGPTLSFHLKELSAAGLVCSRREGRSVIYSVDYAGLRSLVDFLTADCCAGDPRIVGGANNEICRGTVSDCAAQ